MDILERIVQAKRAQIARDKAESPVRRMIELATTALPPRDLPQALRRAAGMAVIAEIKRASPSKGEIKPGADVAAIAGMYEQAGAAALSVLTEAGFFLGAPEHLGEAKRAVSVPILRKDFILEEYQIYESRVLGADSILLIARILTSRELGTLIGVSRSLHMEPLVEVHSEEEADRALGAGAAILGVNNRDLATMTVSIENSLRIAPRLPAGVLKVSESGIESPLDIERLRGAGYDAVLVGERLMREADPGAALRALIGGRE
jgi:indole-3-glycerol phosphate synthase